MHSIDPELLSAAIALDEQEQRESSQIISECLHEFDYNSSYGERVCSICDVVDPHPMLSDISYLSNYTTRSINKGLYLKKCITQHQEQYNCSIPYVIYDDFGKFQRYFIVKFPNEPKISIRYTLYCILKRYKHPCSETDFLKIKLCKTRERYELICDQIFEDLDWN